MLKTREDPALLKARDETDVRLKAMAANIAELAKRVDSDEDAVVEVRNTVYPGVIVTICHIRVSIDEAMKKTRFRLDRTANRIVLEH